MLEQLQQFDIWLFHILNSGIANPIFDKFFPFITELNHWILLYVVTLFLLLWKGGKRGRVLALALIVTIIVSDQLSSNILKNFFERLRPCKTLEGIRLLVDCGPGKSFPSSHAVNNFALASVVFIFYRRYAAYFWTMAFLMAFSRVYCGVHYPLDIIAGTIIGITVGYIVGIIIFKIFKFDKKE